MLDRRNMLAVMGLTAFPQAILAAKPKTSHPGMILGPGPEGGADDAKVGVGVVRRAPDGKYLLWYYARDRNFDKAAPPSLGSGRVCLAQSKDGKRFIRVKGPKTLGCVLEPSADHKDFDSLHLGVTDISRVSDEWFMWYFGADNSQQDTKFGKVGGLNMLTGVAKSRDGVNWEKLRGKGPGGSVFNKQKGDIFAGWPNAIYARDRHFLYYTAVSTDGGRYRTYLASAKTPDGDWEQHGEISLTGPAPQWLASGMMTRQVLPNPFGGQGTWLMLFTALDNSPFPGQKRTIGMAISDDLMRWKIIGDQPVFTPAAEGHWDGGGVSAPQLVMDGQTSKLYYFGFNETPGAVHLPKGVGLATTTKPILKNLVRVIT